MSDWYVILIFDDRLAEQIDLENDTFDGIIEQVKNIWATSPCIGFTLIARSESLIEKCKATRSE